MCADFERFANALGGPSQGEMVRRALTALVDGTADVPADTGRRESAHLVHSFCFETNPFTPPPPRSMK